MDNFIDTDQWVPVHTLPGLESAIEYYINRKGEVLSTKGGKEKLLSRSVTKNGYLTVCLQQRIGQKKAIAVHVHKLVAFAFLPAPTRPYGATKGCCVIDHIDDDKMNNDPSNLRFITHEENINKRPYSKFKKVERTPEEEEAYKAEKRLKHKLYRRKYRARKKSLKIEESDN